MKNEKIKYLSLNLIAPGIGQFASKKWIRGALMLLLTLLFLAWFTWELLFPIIELYKNMLSDNPSSNPFLSVHFNWGNILISFAIVVILWTWSFVDVIFSTKKMEEDIK